jgi:hypothetical protein
MSAFLLMLGVIGAGVWAAWAINADAADRAREADELADAAEDEWLGAA